MNTNNQIVQVKIEDIVPNRYQPRLKFNDQDLSDLASSIKQYGIIQPLTLRPFDTKFEIIAGERRYRAAKLLGMQTVPAIIMNINDQTSAEIALVENIQRKDLNAIEEAKAYQKILELENITQEELAKRIGKSPTTISNKIRLLELSDEVQNAVLDNKISERHARVILRLNNFESQKEVLQKIISEKLTVKLTEELISNNYKDNQRMNNIGDDKQMNEQNYNTLTNQPVGTIPETPLPQTPPAQNNSMFNNNFFPSLEDEKTNMGLNPWDAPAPDVSQSTPVTPEAPTMSSNPLPEPNVNPWDVPVPNAEPQPPQPANNNSPLEFNVPTEQNNNQFDFNNNIQPSPASTYTEPTPVAPNLDFNQVPNNDIQPPVQPEPMQQNLNVPNFSEPQPNNNPLPGFIDQQSFNQPVQSSSLNNNANELIPMVRKAISEIDPSGSKIQTSEIDLENEYQIIIKIPKGSF